MLLSFSSEGFLGLLGLFGLITVDSRSFVMCSKNATLSLALFFLSLVILVPGWILSSTFSLAFSRLSFKNLFFAIELSLCTFSASPFPVIPGFFKLFSLLGKAGLLDDIGGLLSNGFSIVPFILTFSFVCSCSPRLSLGDFNFCLRNSGTLS